MTFAYPLVEPGSRLVIGNIKGTWNASTNSPTLASGVGTQDDTWIVGNAGTTTLDGISVWAPPDVAFFSGGAWKRGQFSSFYGTVALQDADNIDFTGGSIVGLAMLGLSGGSAFQPSGILGGQLFSHYWRDAAGNISTAIRLDGSFQTHTAYTVTLNTGTLSADAGAVTELTSTNISFRTLIVSPAVTDWLISSKYQLTFKDANGNISTGLRNDGGWDFAAANIAELTLVSYGVAAAGTTQGGATPVPSGIVSIDGGTGGIKLLSTPGGAWKVANTTGSAVNAYPDSGVRIGTLSVNSPVSIPANTTAFIWQATTTQSQQLSGGGGGGGLPASFNGTGLPQARDMHDRVADTVNVYDLVTGLDPTGVTDNSTLIKSAHDQGFAKNYRYLEFPAGDYDAPTADHLGNMIFVGENARLIGTYRKLILPRHLGPKAPTNDVSPKFHWPRFMPVVAAATGGSPARVLIIGDSTTTPIAQAQGVGEYLPSLIHRQMYAYFGTKPFVITELGIGGTKWDDLASASPASTALYPFWYTDVTKAWMFYVNAFGPFDLVIFNFGQNDAGTFSMAAMLSAVSQVAALSTTADFAFCTCYCPSIQDASFGTQVAQEGRDYAAGITRTYAKRTGAALFDFNRQQTLIRDGFDVREGSMSILTAITSMTLPFSFPQTTYHYAVSLVYANISTMWSGGSLQFQLSSNANNMLILEKDSGTGMLAYTVQTDTGINSVARTVTTFDLTVVSSGTFSLEVKNNHLLLRVRNTDFNMDVDRFGGLFTPRISWSGGAGVSPTSAHASVFVPNQYMPRVLDWEEFSVVPNHINARGMAEIWAPVVEASVLAA